MEASLDHRSMGIAMGLYCWSDNIGSGLPLWLPKGVAIKDALVDYLRQEQLDSGYMPVNTPHIAKSDLFHLSGHMQNYQSSMYPLMRDEDGQEYVLKPMNCPFHAEIYKSELRSYNDLPIRYAEFGHVYRYEQSGALNGVLRSRGFVQDDAHIFCSPDQVRSEIADVLSLMKRVLVKLGFNDYRVRVSDRDDSNKYIGEVGDWKKAISEMRAVCDELGMDYEYAEGEAAFYGPKIDLLIMDSLGREWQMGTVQLDYNLPQRFGLSYINQSGGESVPVMIHRAPFGSLERLVGLLIEHYRGEFPVWLSPVQVQVLPIAERHAEYAIDVQNKLNSLRFDDRRIRAKANCDSLRLQKRILIAEQERIPYILVVGDREIQDNMVSVRERNKDGLVSMGLDEFVSYMQ